MYEKQYMYSEWLTFSVCIYIYFKVTNLKGKRWRKERGKIDIDAVFIYEILKKQSKDKK